MTADEQPSSIANLAAFVASTIGPVGAVHHGRGVVCVASPVSFANGFVNAAFVPDPEVDRRGAVDEAVGFFATRRSPFVMWSPDDDGDLRDEITRAGGALDGPPTPDMFIDHRIATPPAFEVRAVASAHDFEACARVCEEGYEIDGMAWLMAHHRMGSAAGVTWAVAYDGEHPLGAGCGFMHGADGGVYYVATPPRNARRGVAGAVTTWLVNHLLDQGAASVALQASAAGFPVYERLGFEVRGHLVRYVVEPDPASTGTSAAAPPSRGAQ